MAGKVFLDANIIMELFFVRRLQSEVLEVLAKADAEITNVVSILSVDLLYYFVEREKKQKTDAHAFLNSLEVLDMTSIDYEWAMTNDLGDFEDALQVACALRHGCSNFVTLDRQLATRHNKHIPTKLVA